MENTHKLTKENVVKGTLWNYSSFVLSKGLSFVSSIVLGRILAPDDFGLLSMGLLAINFLDVLNEMGVGTALIYQQGDVERKSNVAFTLSLGVNFILMVLAIVSAPLAALYFKEARVITIIHVLAICFILSSLGSIHAARLTKALKFKRIFIPDLTRTVVKTVVSIGLALAGFGVWSLVIGHVTGLFFWSVVYWFISPWRPKFAFDWENAKALVGYGSQIMLISLLGMIHQNVDYLIIGRRMDSTQLGFYTIAFRIPELIIINICQAISQALFPAYSKLQEDLAALQKGFLLTLRYVALFTVPAGVGLYLLSSDFITLFYTEKWAASIPAMQLLCLYAIVYSLSFNAGDIYKALGKPWILIPIAIVKLVITVPVLWYAAGISIYAVAAGQLMTDFFMTLLKLFIASRIVKINPIRILGAIQPALIASLVMFAGLYFVKLQMTNATELLRVIIIPCIGVLIYALVLWVTNRDLVDSIIRLAKSIIVSKYRKAG